MTDVNFQVRKGITITDKGSVRFVDETNTNSVSLEAPAIASGNITWVLPSSDGVNGGVLITNGSGVLNLGAITDANVEANAGINSTKLAFTQSGTGAITRTVDTKLKEEVSVKDFGAVGDGVTDDTEAIRAAIDSSVSVFFPSGTYLMSERITLQSNQRLYGTGKLKAAAVLVANPDAWASTHWAFFTGYQIDNVEVTGLSFEVLDTLAKPGAGGVRGVFFVDCSNVLINGCSFYGKGGITGMVSCTKYTITNCRCTVVTEGWADGGIDNWAETDPCRDFVIDSNYVNGGGVCPWTILITGFTGNSCRDFTISNNILENSLYTAIWVNGRDAINGAFSIVGNTISDSHQGIRISDCNNGLISCNTITRCNYQGIVLDYEAGEGTTSSNNCVVTSNSLYDNNLLHNGSEDSAVGISIEEDSSSNLVSSNSIINPSNKHKYAIRLTGNSADNYIINNYYNSKDIINQGSGVNYIDSPYNLYTPTFSGLLNLNSASYQYARFNKSQNKATVEMKALVDVQAASTPSVFYVTTPIAQTFTHVTDVFGFVQGGVGSGSAATTVSSIEAVPSGTVTRVAFESNQTGYVWLNLMFNYIVV